MQRRRLIASVGAAVIGLIVTTGRALATPPPPPPREGIEAEVRIAALHSFLGAWEGDEVFTAPGEGSFRTSIYRQLIRPGGKDFILSVYYRNDHLTSVDAIIYSPQDSEYRFIQPGVRYMAPSTRADTEIPLKLATPDRLQWRTIEDGAPCDQSVELAGDEWREQSVLHAANGPALTSRAVLKRAQTLRWVVPA